MQGTLDTLILRVLVPGSGPRPHQIAKHIERTTDDVLRAQGLGQRQGGRAKAAGASSSIPGSLRRARSSSWPSLPNGRSWFARLAA